MKKLLILTAFLLSAFLGFTQNSGRDTVLLTNHFGKNVDDSFQIITLPTEVTLHIMDTGLNHVTIKFQKDTLEALTIPIGEYLGDWWAPDASYYQYFDGYIENTKDSIVFCIKWNVDNGTINSFGMKARNGGIIAFYVKYDQPAEKPKDPETKSLK